MKIDDANHNGDLQKLYRASARERSSTRIDTHILQLAREHAHRRRNQSRRRFAISAVAAMLLLLIGQLWHRQRVETQAYAAARAHYAEVTQAYLLNMPISVSNHLEVTRYLLNLRESDQPVVLPDFVAPVVPPPAGI